MRTVPRFLKVNSKVYLMSVTKVKGIIVDISGPYQCTGADGVEPEALMQGLTESMHIALHEQEILTLGDLNESLRDQILESLK